MAKWSTGKLSPDPNGSKWSAPFKNSLARTLLVWDATCLDTFALSHRSLVVHSAGGIAAKAEDLKGAKYADLLSSHIFVPVAIETTGVFGPCNLSFVKSLG